MAANFTEIKARLDYYCDETVSPTTAIQMFNQCNEDIAFISGYSLEKIVAFSQNTPVMPLPADFIDMQELKLKLNSWPDYIRLRSMGLEQPHDMYTTEYPFRDGSMGYEIFADNIEIRANEILEDGLLLYRYYGYLPNVANINDVPKLKPRFHDLYALFGASKYFQNYLDEIPTKTDYWNEYLMKRKELEQEFNRIKTRARSKTVYIFKPWH